MNAIRPLLLVAALAAPLAAPAVQCGTSRPVYSSVSLSADLVCPPGEGLVIGASYLRIDLNGFSIVSQGSNGLPNTGVSSWGFHDIKIVGPGRISGFDTSMAVDNGYRNEIRDVDLADLSPAGMLNGEPALVMRNTRDSVVEKSRIGRMLVQAGPVQQATGNRIQYNDATAIVLLGAGVADNDVTGNKIRALGSPAITVIEGRRNRIYGNSLSGHVYLGSAALTLVEGNTIQYPGSWPLWSGVVLMDTGSGFAALDNVVRSNGIFGGNFGVSMLSGAIRNKVIDNKIDGADAGFFFGTGADFNDAGGNWLSNVPVTAVDAGRGNIWP